MREQRNHFITGLVASGFENSLGLIRYDVYKKDFIKCGNILKHQDRVVLCVRDCSGKPVKRQRKKQVSEE